MDYCISNIILSYNVVIFDVGVSVLIEVYKHKYARKSIIVGQADIQLFYVPRSAFLHLSYIEGILEPVVVMNLDVAADLIKGKINQCIVEEIRFVDRKKRNQ